MKPPARLPRRASSSLLAALLVPALLSSVPAASAEEPTRDTTTIAPADALLGAPQQGRKAIRQLGEELPVAASRNDLRTAELRELLRTDETVWVDKQGSLYYVDPAPDSVRRAGKVTTDAQAAPLEDTFALHSNPGASLTILLDFDGAYVSGTQWNSQSGVTPATHPAWDPAGNGPTFSDAEKLQVQQTWAMVAEDYAPFDVDVTTQDPGDAGMVRSSSADTVYGTRVLVTPSADPMAKICPTGCGGVAYVGSFAVVGSAYQPAWVFPQALGQNPKNIAEAASHEAGHNLGLNHDGTASLGYYTGHGVWAPIMGVGYHRPVVQWSRGSYVGANNQQDDLAIVSGYLGSRPDEAASSEASPSILPEGEAVISTPDDVDAYLLGACAAGTVVDVLPAAVAPNLDVRAVLYDADGTQRSVGQPVSGSGDGTTATGLGASVTVPTAGDGWVLAVEGVGEGSWAGNGYDDYGSLGAYTVSAPGCDGEVAPGVPGAPGDVTATVVGTDALTLDWAAPAVVGDGPITGYVVSRSGSDASETLVADARSHTFTGLAAGMTYQLTVSAVNASGAGPSVTVTATTQPPAPAAPSAPRDMTGSYDQATDTLTAWWTEPLDSGTQPITNYAIYLDGAYVGQLGSTARGVNITNPNGFAEGEHVIGVAAVNAVGSSPLATTTVTVDRPDAPANDAVADAEVLAGNGGSVPGDNTYATAEATDPPPPSAFDAGGYSVWYSWTPAADGEVTLATSGGGSNRDTTLAVYTGDLGGLVEVAGADDTVGLHASVTFDAVADTRYLVAVDGFSGAGGSGPFTLTWSQQLAGAPSAPTGVAAVRGDQTATVTWSAPEDNGSPITGYTVAASPGGATCSTTGGLSCVVAGLTNGTAYTFTVRATNAVGVSAGSDPSAAVTPAGVPVRPGAPAAVRGDAQATVTWAATAGNGSPVTGYSVTASPGGASCSTTGSLSCAVAGLTNGTAYTFTVRATNAVGVSAASDPSAAVTPAGVPVRPGAPTAVRGDAQATVTWATTASNGSPVTGYSVTASPGGATCSTTGSLSCAVVGLTNGTAYTFTVRATNAVGVSAGSDPSVAVTPAGVPVRPGAPTAVRGDQSATVTWPATAGNGSPVTGYSVTASPGGATCSTTGGLSCAVAGLTNGTAYTFTVRAVNAVGVSAASDPSAAVTPAGVPVRPGAPTAVAGDGVATVLWASTAANGSPVTGYTVTASPGGATCSTTGGLSCLVPGLTNGTAYTFTVRATNAVGISAASDPSAAVTPAGVPSTMARPKVVVRGTKAIVTWQAATANGSPVTRYLVDINKGRDSSAQGTARKAVLKKLKPGRYKIRIAARNAVGTSPYSPWVKIRVR